MRRFLTLLLLLSSLPGCAAMEDMVFGPPPAPHFETRPMTNEPSCNAPPPKTVQTQEPEIGRR